MQNNARKWNITVYLNTATEALVTLFYNRDILIKIFYKHDLFLIYYYCLQSHYGILRGSYRSSVQKLSGDVFQKRSKVTQKPNLPTYY